ncbi:hypothetical protein CYLTODRAFT_343963 [Cylindrobasidium torrendii FP15055 ss-10]|uniref:Mid2 domain-containing protein n=1 Tax=Cylindrobasidium torrendii FP15055 ss-10 TaxID=1314674 RepID=A0A0D7BQD1_9AGAR|nr:hypothetical protein CYLTODRAFT_343963 [Cylindrobasidium torrendii FP15055 ss-10]
MKASRSLLLSCLLAVAVVQASEKTARQLSISLPGSDDATTTATSAKPTSTSSSTKEETSTSETKPTTTSTATATSATSTSTTDKPSNADTTSKPENTSSTIKTTQAPVTTEEVTTNSVGDAVTITRTHTPTAAADPSSSSSSSDDSSSGSNSNKDDKGLGTGSIVGIAVAGGIALIGVLAFVYWKFTRKRFNDFDDTEAIKWPELNAHGGPGGNTGAVPLPTHNTGRAGFDTSSEVSLSRTPSQTGTNYSTPDLGMNDPYAVPPLPHLNPGQPMPYRDDPNASGAFYDPYRGPVPQTIHDKQGIPGAGWQQPGDAYPMTQMGRASPGPTAALGMYDAGRMSPAPMAGRASPGPQAAYGMGVPQYGRASPGPGAAYDPYGAR